MLKMRTSRSLAARSTSVAPVVMVMVVALCCLPPVCGSIWLSPGCHQVGFQRPMNISGCVEFTVEMNACRGFCLSYAVPSDPNTMNFNPNLIITSHAECCSMEDSEDVRKRVRCVDGEREFVFKSALTCACSVCRRG